LALISPTASSGRRAVCRRTSWTVIAPYVSDRIVRARLEARPEDSSGDRRVRLPEAWAGSERKPIEWRKLALFLEGRRVPITIGPSGDSSPLPRAFVRPRRVPVRQR
jgi:hypothetical protein